MEQVNVTIFSYVDTYDRILGTADHLLTKGVDAAEFRGVSEPEMLDWRLIENMHPLRFQLATVCTVSQQWLARAADISPPQKCDDQSDVAGFRDAIIGARAFATSLREAQFEGRADVDFRYAITPEMELVLPLSRWLSVFVTTNMYFHLSTAYGILRAHGASLGKADLFPLGL